MLELLTLARNRTTPLPDALMATSANRALAYVVPTMATSTEVVHDPLSARAERRTAPDSS